MTKPEISILMPAIRPQNWTKVYESILSSTRRSFELVIVGPHHYQKIFYNIKILNMLEISVLQ